MTYYVSSGTLNPTHSLTPYNSLHVIGYNARTSGSWLLLMLD